MKNSALATAFFVLCLQLVRASLYTDHYPAPEILDQSRNPISYTIRSGNIVTVGHFRGVLKQGIKSVCNALTCYKMPQYKYASRGWGDIFVSVYNSSRQLQWTRTAGGNGDDKARSVVTNLDGNILVTGYITGMFAKFSGLELSSRSAMSRTIFIATYSPEGAILGVREAASCLTGQCDISAMTSDETGVLLTGKFRGRITFGVKQSCTSTLPTQCLPVEVDSIHMGNTPSAAFDGKETSTGSGFLFNEYCWVAKFDHSANYIWHKFCDDPALENDLTRPLTSRITTFEQQEWTKRAKEFFVLNPRDATGLLGKDSNYADVAARRVPYGI